MGHVTRIPTDEQRLAVVLAAARIDRLSRRASRLFNGILVGAALILAARVALALQSAPPAEPHPFAMPMVAGAPSLGLSVELFPQATPRGGPSAEPGDLDPLVVEGDNRAALARAVVRFMIEHRADDPLWKRHLQWALARDLYRQARELYRQALAMAPGPDDLLTKRIVDVQRSLYALLRSK